jgi:purine-binding chemotaxis protein CheW
VGHQRLEILVFVMGDRRYGLPAADIQELVRAVAITPLPGAPPMVEGVVNIRGRVIPVHDIRPRLGLPAKALELSDHLIVIGALDAPAALRIDRAIALTEAEFEDVTEGTSAAGAARVAKLTDGLVPILELAAIRAPADGGPGPSAGRGGTP